ncbi:hypothetical protein [Paraburkholderia bryophila]|uniref:Transmembrane protein n=1 Tax=Paraburkholderia bryophila TaxID=420952 RepID=A0A7Y9WHW1_9BURK|nr:hypothetical protein [Paraburkholderia bryophila]NYH20437.1 hypothetical protein [Paraburkholderia bryophila]NYH20536.1 hypothetical protein [Paraburkholderia bryophila]
MKPLLRAVLILDALLLLAFGLLFLLTPWTSLYNALLLVQTQPALVGQAFGVALIGLAWLAFHASIAGALTSTVAKVVGHVNWLTGVLMLVWLLGLHTPALTGFGQIVAVLTGVVLLVIGLGGVRLSGAVRRREKERLVDAAAAGRAEKQAAKDAAKDAANRREPERVTAGFPVYRAEPAVAPVVEPVVPVVPVTRPVDTVATGTFRPAVDESALTPSERAARAESTVARDEARNAAADAPGGPRPPFHG